MTSKPSIDGLTFTRDCYGHPIRIFMWDGCPWFEAAPLRAAMAIDPAALDRFKQDAPPTDIAACPSETETADAFSAIGHLKFVEAYASEMHAKFASWSRRTAFELVPRPAPDDARFHLTLNANGSRPPRPSRFTGRLDEWKDLKLLPEYRTDRGIAMAQSWDAARAARQGDGQQDANSEHDVDAGIARLLARVAARSAMNPTPSYLPIN